MYLVISTKDWICIIGIILRITTYTCTHNMKFTDEHKNMWLKLALPRFQISGFLKSYAFLVRFLGRRARFQGHGSSLDSCIFLSIESVESMMFSFHSNYVANLHIYKDKTEINSELPCFQVLIIMKIAVPWLCEWCWCSRWYINGSSGSGNYI